MNVFKSLTPLLGTFLRVEAQNCSEVVWREALALAAGLESIFSLFCDSSEINRFNALPVGIEFGGSGDFVQVVRLACEIWRESQSAFNPFFPDRFDVCPLQLHGLVKLELLKLDLNGIAKGYIVDRVAEHLRICGASGSVNAGGEIRFFNLRERHAHIRVGDPAASVLRPVALDRDALATSSLAVALNDERSSSCYEKNLRAGLSPLHAVSVAANNCYVADALTKVGLYAPIEVVRHCARQFSAQFFTFDPSGTLIEAC